MGQNTSVRKFLKKLGVTAQREIEMAVRDADAKGLLKGSDRLPARRLSRSAALTSNLRSMETSSWRDFSRLYPGDDGAFTPLLVQAPLEIR
jgi:Family of unknown function (DUF6494)